MKTDQSFSKILIPFLLVVLFAYPLIAHAGSAKNLKAFLSFCGIQYGDNKAVVQKKLGEPSRVKNSGNNKSLYYFVNESDNFGGLMISLNRFRTGKVESITLYTSEAVESLKKLGIKDSKMAYFGKHKKEILKSLGKPESDNSGAIEYYYNEENGPSVHVYFYCYDSDNYECSKIFLTWQYL